ncbi:MAG: helix-turn-helix domain-containing protein [Bacteriovoracaceae bacterium]
MKNIQVCTKIHKARKDSGLTRESLSESVGVSSTTIQRWENGTSKIFFEDLLKVSKILNKPLSYFSDDEQEASEASPKIESIKELMAEHQLKLSEIVNDNNLEDIPSHILEGLQEIAKHKDSDFDAVQAAISGTLESLYEEDEVYQANKKKA